MVVNAVPSTHVVMQGRCAVAVAVRGPSVQDALASPLAQEWTRDAPVHHAPPFARVTDHEHATHSTHKHTQAQHERTPTFLHHHHHWTGVTTTCTSAWTCNAFGSMLVHLNPPTDARVCVRFDPHWHVLAHGLCVCTMSTPASSHARVSCMRCMHSMPPQSPPTPAKISGRRRDRDRRHSQEREQHGI